MRMLRKVSAAYTTGCKPEIHREARRKTLPMSPAFLFPSFAFSYS